MCVYALYNIYTIYNMLSIKYKCPNILLTSKNLLQFKHNFMKGNKQIIPFGEEVIINKNYPSDKTAFSSRNSNLIIIFLPQQQSFTQLPSENIIKYKCIFCKILFKHFIQDPENSNTSISAFFFQRQVDTLKHLALPPPQAFFIPPVLPPLSQLHTKDSQRLGNSKGFRSPVPETGTKTQYLFFITILKTKD